jgi:hypothetical protein
MHIVTNEIWWGFEIATKCLTFFAKLLVLLKESYYSRYRKCLLNPSEGSHTAV